MSKLSEIDALLLERDRQAGTAPDAQFAVDLHAATCRSNHTDQCAWFYERRIDDLYIEDWRGATHQRWLDDARALLKDYGEAFTAKQMVMIAAAKDGKLKDLLTAILKTR